MLRQEISVADFQGRLQASEQGTNTSGRSFGGLVAATRVLAGEAVDADTTRPSADAPVHGTPYLHVPPRRVQPPAAHPAAVQRTHSWLAAPPHFALLVDVFRAAEPQPFELVISSPNLIEKSANGYRAGDLHFVPLGDYFPRVERPNAVSFTQRFIQGRFLIAATLEPAARFRVLNGWSIEAQLAGQTWHLLHSNQGRKFRPLGPILTDAGYGLVHWPPRGSGENAGVDTVRFALLGVETLEWEGRQIRFQPPTDIACTHS